MLTKSTEQQRIDAQPDNDLDSLAEFSDPMVSILTRAWRVSGAGADIWGRIQSSIDEIKLAGESNVKNRAQAFSASDRFPTCRLTNFQPQTDAIDSLSAKTAIRYLALPIQRKGNRLWVAMANPRNTASVDAVRMESQCLVQPMYAMKDQLVEALLDAYGQVNESALAGDNTDTVSLNLQDTQLTDMAHHWQLDTNRIDIWDRVESVIENSRTDDVLAPLGILHPNYVPQPARTTPVLATGSDLDRFTVYLTDSNTDLPPLTEEQETILVTALESGAAWAHNVFVRANRMLALSIAREYQGEGLTDVELAMEALRALEMAVQRYVRHREFRFSTFATHLIHRILTMVIDSKKYGENTQVSYIDLKSISPEPEALSAISATTALRYQVLPLNRTGDELWLAMTDTSDSKTLDVIRSESRCVIHPLLANHRELEIALNDAYGKRQPPRPPFPPTAIGASGEEPTNNANDLLISAISEIRELRNELHALRGEVAALRQERTGFVPRPVPMRLFPFAPESGKRRQS